MKITRLGRSRPLVNITAGTTGTDTGASGSVITSTGSNGETYWGPNVATITSNSSNTLTGPFVNFASGTGVSFAAASNTLTISATGTGEENIFDHLWFNVRDYGAVADGVTDDTAAIQSAINAAHAAGRGTVWFPANASGVTYYQLDGALQDTGTFNSQLKIPDAPSSYVSLTFRGESGVVLRSSWAGTISGNPAVISCGTHDSTTVSLVFLRFENFALQVPENPKLTGIDATKAATLRWHGLSVSSVNPSGTVPTNTNAIGLDLPYALNDQNSGGEDLWVQGFYVGVRPGEQMIADAIYASWCKYAVEMRGAIGTPEFIQHAIHIQRLNVWFCINGILFTGDTRWVYISLMDVETEDPGWTTIYSVDDPNNYGRGFIGWHTGNYGGGPTDDFAMNGGTGLSLHGGHARRWKLNSIVDVPTGTDPSTNPTNGFRLYAASASGKPTTRSSAGTVTTIMREGDTAGGDLSGTYPNPSVVDDSHSHTTLTAPSGGELLISDSPSTPLVFADILQTEAEDDFLYAD